MAPDTDRIDAIVSVPEDRRVKANFDRDILLDLSTPDAEFENLMYPLNQVFDKGAWQQKFLIHCIQNNLLDRVELVNRFNTQVLENFQSYQIPVIALGHDTTHEAVCLVFEKVNTGGKALDAFELVTAMYAAKGYRLRDDWFGTQGEPATNSKPAIPAQIGDQVTLRTCGAFADQRTGVLERIASTDLLQAIALLHSRRLRLDAIAAGRPEAEWPPVRATKQSLLELPLDAYVRHRAEAVEGFRAAVRFLRLLNVYRVIDLPYQTQLVPLAAILAIIGPKIENGAVREKLNRWYWCGIFGELYGSAIESRFALDVMQVPAWLDGGAVPATVEQGALRADRLRSMRSRLSAAYKGVHALLMFERAKDFRTGEDYSQAVFFDDQIDIHHIFPAAWCTGQKIPSTIFDSIINKTPIGFRTNRMIGGVAPSAYTAKIEKGSATEPAIPAVMLDEHLKSHCIDPVILRADDFPAFMADREKRLMALVAKATGHGAVGADSTEGGEGDDVPEDVARDAGILTEAAE